MAPALAFTEPERVAMLWNPRDALSRVANGKRRTDRPFVVGQWCTQSKGEWAIPYEAGDFMLGVQTAKCEDWDAIVRRGVFMFPEAWGSGPAGSGGAEDIFPIPQAINGMPHVFALLPHAASLFLRGQAEPAKPTLSGWSPQRGQLVINNAYTQGVAGWWAGDHIEFETLSMRCDNRYAVIMATSIGRDPIAKAARLLVTAIARVEPTGLMYVDEWKSAVAQLGRPPFLQEPVAGRIVWKTSFASKLKAYSLDNDGKRTSEVKLVKSPQGDAVELAIEGGKPVFHYELVAEE